MAIIQEDGTVTLGIDTVTPERIPMFFRGDKDPLNVIFIKQ